MHVVLFSFVSYFDPFDFSTPLTTSTPPGGTNLLVSARPTLAGR